MGRDFTELSIVANRIGIVEAAASEDLALVDLLRRRLRGRGDAARRPASSRGGRGSRRRRDRRSSRAGGARARRGRVGQRARQRGDRDGRRVGGRDGRRGQRCERRARSGRRSRSGPPARLRTVGGRPGERAPQEPKPGERRERQRPGDDRDAPAGPPVEPAYVAGLGRAGDARGTRLGRRIGRPLPLGMRGGHRARERAAPAPAPTGSARRWPRRRRARRTRRAPAAGLGLRSRNGTMRPAHRFWSSSSVSEPSTGSSPLSASYAIVASAQRSHRVIELARRARLLGAHVARASRRRAPSPSRTPRARGARG